MARTIAQIFDSIIAEKDATPLLSGLTSASKVSVWRLWAYVIATAIWAHEKVFDKHLEEVTNIIENKNAHTNDWYAQAALDFQYGYSLAPKKAHYDNTGIDPALIEASKVVKHASAAEGPARLIIKVSGESGGELAPLPTAQFNALKVYFTKKKDAGVKLTFKNLPADTLRLHLKIHYNPLILDAAGKRLDGTNDTPVQSVAYDYPKNGIGFDGLFDNAELVDRLQAIDGVEVPQLILAESRYGSVAFTPIEAFRQPDAGWMRLAPSDLTIDFVPYEFI